MLLEEALTQPEGNRQSWLASKTTNDPKAYEKTLRLLRSAESASEKLATGGSEFDDNFETPPEHIGAYRVVERLGQGGMGTVFKAQREAGDFDHEVAIKVIRPGALSDALVERFERERQILASLTHPNIARLYDGGTTDEGGPYFVMEFIEGVPITKWAEEEKLSLDDRLKLMVQVCEAVGFAHQNLIVHRDLTPRNVLVTEDGTPKLIDFGIARPQDEDREPGLDGAAPGHFSLTPGFAAPERYNGTAATTLTDIFSLGKLLERLTDEKNGDPDLAAIREQATAQQPEDRYTTAGALAGDLERYRTGYPVEARHGGRWHVFGKFFNRNRVSMLLALGTIFLLISAFAATIFAYSQAETERARAGNRFSETRAIARSMMFDVYDEVSRVPGSVKARLLLADTAQRYLESLAEDASADVDVRYDAARGYFRLAEVIGARTGGGNVGLTSRAQQYYVRSRALLEALHSDYPERRDIQSSLGQALTVMADSALLSDGNFEIAKTNATEARRLLGDLPELDADSAGALVMSYVHEGNAFAFEGEPEQAGEVYRAGMRALHPLPASLRATPEVRRAQAELLKMTGAYHSYFKRPDDARRVIESSLTLRKSIAEQTNYPPRDIYGLVAMLQVVAQMELASGNIARAHTLTTEAVDRARQGMAGSPDDAGAQELFTSVAIAKGQVLSALGRRREAIDLADEAIALKRILSKRSGDVVSGPMTLAVRLQEASEVYLAAGDGARACPVMRESVKIMRNYEKTAELPIANRTNNLEPMLKALRDC